MINLQDAKEHLNVTTTIDDQVIMRLIDVAKNWLDHAVGYSVLERYPYPTPAALDHALLLMVGHLYANREATLVGVTAQELPLGVNDLISGFRDWSWGYAADE